MNLEDDDELLRAFSSVASTGSIDGWGGGGGLISTAPEDRPAESPLLRGQTMDSMPSISPLPLSPSPVLSSADSFSTITGPDFPPRLEEQGPTLQQRTTMDTVESTLERAVPPPPHFPVPVPSLQSQHAIESDSGIRPANLSSSSRAPQRTEVPEDPANVSSVSHNMRIRSGDTPDLVEMKEQQRALIFAASSGTKDESGFRSLASTIVSMRGSGDARREVMLDVMQEELDAAYSDRQPDPLKVVRAIVTRPPPAGVLMKGAELPKDSCPVVEIFLAPSCEIVAVAGTAAVVQVLVSGVSGKVCEIPASAGPSYSAGNAKRRDNPGGRHASTVLKVPKGGQGNQRGLAAVSVRIPLVFSSGTRKLPARVSFAVTVSTNSPYFGRAKEVCCTTDQCEPFVVATHESQWSDCAGRLLRDRLFNAASSLTYEKFSSGIEEAFSQASRQPSSDCGRKLTRSDVAYLVDRFFPKSTFTEPLYDKLWDWLGPSLQALRFMKGVSSLWLHGLIFGLTRREVVDSLLIEHGVGSFLVRFSERFAGRLAIDFNAGHGMIKHYLVRTKDLKVSLADFIVDNDHFQTVVRVSDGSTLVPMQKLSAFSQFAAAPKKKSSGKRENKSGYDPL